MLSNGRLRRDLRSMEGAIITEYILFVFELNLPFTLHLYV